MKKKVFLAAVLLILVLSLFGEEPIRVGGNFAFTGEASAVNIVNIVGARMAVEEINHRGGVLGRMIDFIEIDNQSTALGARRAARQAVDQGVVAVIGPSWSSQAFGAAGVLQEARIPMITHTATNPDVTKVGNYIFRVCFTDDYQGAVIARFAYVDLQARRVAVLVNAGSSYSVYLAEVFERSFKSYGGSIAMTLPYEENITNYDDMLKSLKNLSYDVVFIPGYSRDAAYIIEAAVALGINTTFLGGDGWSPLMYNYSNNSVEGSYYLTHWSKHLDTEANRQFVERLSQIYDPAKISAGQALAYDAVYLLADAINRAGSADPEAIQNALAETIDFEGVSGTIRFDGNGDPLKSAVVLQFRGGEVQFLKTLSANRQME